MRDDRLGATGDSELHKVVVSLVWQIRPQQVIDADPAAPTGERPQRIAFGFVDR